MGIEQKIMENKTSDDDAEFIIAEDGKWKGIDTKCQSISYEQIVYIQHMKICSMSNDDGYGVVAYCSNCDDYTTVNVKKGHLKDEAYSQLCPICGNDTLSRQKNRDM